MGILGLLGLEASANPLEVGAAAPDITAKNQDGKDVNFADVYVKGPTLVYFYPKADTPGCTAQACSLRDSYVDLRKDDLTILGVSADTPEAQKKFQEKYEIPFELIADEKGEVAKAFGVPSRVGKFHARQSFIVKDGKIVWSSLKAQTKGAAEEIQKALDNI